MRWAVEYCWAPLFHCTRYLAAPAKRSHDTSSLVGSPSTVATVRPSTPGGSSSSLTVTGIDPTRRPVAPESRIQMTPSRLSPGLWTLSSTARTVTVLGVCQSVLLNDTLEGVTLKPSPELKWRR